MLFKIRSSASGRIMAGSVGLSDPQQREYDKLIAKEKVTTKQAETLALLIERRANPQLPKGAKTYCEEWLKCELYKRKIEISSKYMSKGNDVEGESIEYIAAQMGYGMLIKNKERFSNDFIEGEPDVIIKDAVIDAKNSWDFTTFPLFEDKVPDTDYYWQGQCYMELTKKPHYRLIYTLIDTPEYLIQREFSSYCYKNNLETEEAIYNEFHRKMTYDDVEDSLKIKAFDFDYNPDDVKNIETRVKMCREYIKGLLKAM